MKIGNALILVIVIYRCILTTSCQDVRIVGSSDDTSTKKFPFYVFLYRCFNDRCSFCGATYISSLWVLTAAHCLGDLRHNAVTVLTMQLDIMADFHNSSIVQKRNASRLIGHPQYVKTAKGGRKDVGLIKLEFPFNVMEKARPAVLAANPVNYDGDWSVTLIGFGKTDIHGRDDFAEKLKMVIVPVQKRYDCRFSIRNKDTFCVGKHGRVGHSPCSGDSGGPAIYNGVVIGIASFILPVDIGTCASTVGVYEDVSKHLRWIRKYVPDINTSGAQENHIHVLWVPLAIEILNLVCSVNSAFIRQMLYTKSK